MNKKRIDNFNRRLIIYLMLILMVIIGGTFAWFIFRSKESALVLSIGDINDSKIIINPYEIREKMTPVNVYTSGVYSQIKAINNNENEMEINLFYKVNQLDETLINNGLKYTVVSSDTIDGEYTVLYTGDFTMLSSDKKISVFNDEIESTTTKYYRIYVWLDSSVGNQNDVQNHELSIELNGIIEMKANKPVLDSGMIPVTIANDGTVTTISEDDMNWYDYTNQKWANIVLVSSSSRSKYLGTSGETVTLSDIMAYYVWIPRYKYKIWTTTTSSNGKEQSIEIKFENAKEPMSSGTSIGEYKTHPAFWWDLDSDNTFDSGEMVAGIWVGKFETTGSTTTPTVLPNTSALRSQTASALFNANLKFAGGSQSGTTVTFAGNSTYGLTENTDSHMIKNSEWGGIAYLSHSKYGINKQIRLNNYYNNATQTGCGASSDNGARATTCQIKYNSATEYPQSTTGNITGVFDMAGGAWDYTMGNYNSDKGSAGFTNLPASKYYNKYTTTSIGSCTIAMCGGHALNETAGWYSDSSSNFVNSSYEWFTRGADAQDTTSAGIFAFDRSTGKSDAYFGSRSVLIPLSKLKVTFDANGGTFPINFNTQSYTTSGSYEFVAPATGTYKLEVWGAQGMGASITTESSLAQASQYFNDYGGYSFGNISLTDEQIIYVNVGGGGTYNNNDNQSNLIIEGGYNGGGDGYKKSGSSYISSGGGATHIATKSGTLASLSSYATNCKNSSESCPILIVAGGGGGSRSLYTGGSGGGYKGNSANSDEHGVTVTGGTQTSGGTLTYDEYTGLNSGEFGQGGSGGIEEEAGGGGGGGGFYGGAGGFGAGGGGGSGYIGHPKLTDKAMYCYNCSTSNNTNTKTISTNNYSLNATSNYAKAGNGAAKITLVEGNANSDDKEVYYDNTYGELPTPTRDGYTFLAWYTEPAGGTQVTDTTVVSNPSDHTLYARWRSTTTYTISYNANGGTNAPAAQTKYKEEALTLSSATPTRSGYKFIGWTTSSSSTTVTYNPGDSYTNEASITLYAVWEEVKSPVQSYSCSNGRAGTSPYTFTYTGQCTVIDDKNDNWRIKFLTTGTLTVTANVDIDVFLVGGGGGGGSAKHDGVGGGGGGGGKTTTNSTTIVANQKYKLTIGSGGAGGSEDVYGDGSSGTNGGSSSGFNFTATGGNGGSVGNGGSGGSGGGGGGWGNGSSGAHGSDGGYNGGNGGSEGYSGGSGQRTSTYEFGANSGTLYSGGGGGGRGCDNDGCTSPGYGGSGGGGDGGDSGPGSDGDTNTGGGGGGGGARHEIGGDGGSGIIVIRNKR